MKTIETRRANRVTFGLIPDVFDKIVVLYPDTVTEVYVYQLMDESGVYATVGHVEAIYTDSTKENLLSVTRLAT
jgi:hypothetical protein